MKNVEQAGLDATGKTPAELMQDMAETDQRMGGLVEEVIKTLEDQVGQCADCGSTEELVVHDNDRVVCKECDSDYSEQDRC